MEKILLTDRQGQRYVVSRHHCPIVGMNSKPLQFETKSHARQFLANASNGSGLQSCARLLGGSRRSDSLVLNALVEGRIKVFRFASLQQSWPEIGNQFVAKKPESDSLYESSEAPVHKPSAPPKAAPKKESPWVEFQLLDEDTGEPLANVKLKIQLADESEVIKPTDGSGVVKIDDIPEGKCKVLEILDDAGYEVCSMEAVA